MSTGMDKLIHAYCDRKNEKLHRLTFQSPGGTVHLEDTAWQLGLKVR
jgi:hypothetical protein